MNKKYFLVSILLLVLLSTTVATVAATYRHYWGELRYGRKLNVSGFTFDISWTDTTITVIITRASGSWLLEETHLYVGFTPPTSNPGSYPYKHYLGGATSDSYTIPVSELGTPGPWLYFALHAEITGGNCKEETAWGLVTCDPALVENLFGRGWGWYYRLLF